MEKMNLTEDSLVITEMGWEPDEVLQQTFGLGNSCGNSAGCGGSCSGNSGGKQAEST